MKRLLILSGKGGTGKTTVAASFVRFAQAKAAADCDVDAPNLHLVFPQENAPEISEFAGGDKAVIDAQKCIGCGLCQAHCRFHAIEACGNKFAVNEYSCEGCGVCAYICAQGAVSIAADIAGRKELYTGDGVFSTAALKMGRGNSGKLVTEVKLAMLKAAPETRLAVVDGSPGIGCPVISSMSGMDLVLIVAEPSLSGLSDLKRLVKTAEGFETTVAVCVNKYDMCPQKAGEIRRFCEESGISFVGVLPYDKTASEAINAGKSIADTPCALQDALKKVYCETMRLLGIGTD